MPSPNPPTGGAGRPDCIRDDGLRGGLVNTKLSHPALVAGSPKGDWFVVLHNQFEGYAFMGPMLIVDYGVLL